MAQLKDIKPSQGGKSSAWLSAGRRGMLHVSPKGSISRPLLLALDLHPTRTSFHALDACLMCLFSANAGAVVEGRKRQQIVLRPTNPFGFADPEKQANYLMQFDVQPKATAKGDSQV